MKKKILGLILTGILILSIVGCSSKNNENSKNVKDIESEESIQLTDKDINKIQENLKFFTEGTAFDGAKFKINQDKNNLKISVIKPITDIMTEYKTNTADDTVKAIRKSLTFDGAYDVIKEELKHDFNSMQVFIFNGEKELDNNDYYTLKTIR